MIKTTVFSSIFDTDTTKTHEFSSFEDFVGFCRDLSEKPTEKPKKGKRVSNPAYLLSPAVYKPGTSRKNVNVEAWAGWGVLDIDDYDGNFTEIIAGFPDYQSFIYSTGSSTKEKPKFRLIVALDRWVKGDELKHFWFALNLEYLGVGDKQTKDLSRMFYIPGIYKGAYNFFAEKAGKPLRVDDLLSKHPMPKQRESFVDSLPEEIRNALLERQRSRLNNTTIDWTDYRDCPFVSKQALSEYRAISGTGWYHKLYQIMVSIASRAVKSGYPITVLEISSLVRQIDADDGGWYKDRPVEKEAARALEFVLAQEIGELL